jgi:phosphoribosyl-ATP pyrophosphohydrolase
MPSEQAKTLVKFLEEAVETVRRIEREAQEALSGENGQEEYAARMREKALYLSAIGEDSARLTREHPAARRRLERFASSAQTSLSVGSVFFMSALLYPEDHQPGEENDLERLAREVREGEV